VHHTWCIGFEFRDTEKGMCELYEDCSSQQPPAASPSPEPQPAAAAVSEAAAIAAAEAAAAAAASPAPTEAPAAAAEHKTARCLRMADHYFDRWFAAHPDENGSPGRKATVDDCRYACNNASSLHHAWCVSFVFEPSGWKDGKPDAKDAASTCKLYDDCSQPATREDEKLRAFSAPSPESAAAAVADPANHGDGNDPPP